LALGLTRVTLLTIYFIWPQYYAKIKLNIFK
jgi:hypothetical protein